MKLSEVLNEVLDLKAVQDTIRNIDNQLKSLQGQIPEMQKLSQDNAALVKKVEELTRGSMQQNKMASEQKQGTGTIVKGGGSLRATTPSTGPATTPSAPAVTST